MHRRSMPMPPAVGHTVFKRNEEIFVQLLLLPANLMFPVTELLADWVALAVVLRKLLPAWSRCRHPPVCERAAASLP